MCEKTGTWDTAGYVVFVNYVDGTGPTVDPPSQPRWRTEVVAGTEHWASGSVITI